MTPLALELGDLAAWVAIAVSVTFSLAALIVSLNSAKSARRSADASERSADAAEVQARIAQAEADKYQVPWVLERTGKGGLLLTNDGDEAALDVDISGSVLRHDDSAIVSLGARETVRMADVRSFDDNRGLTVTWRRPGEEDVRTWKHPL